MIHTKSAAEVTARQDGLRLYVTRYWPRGHGREECDEWLPNLAPSEKLLRAFQSGQITWPDFQKRYRNEMLKGLADETGANPRMKNVGQKYVIRLLKRLAEQQTVTLICSCPPEEAQCHRHVLKKLIETA